MPLEDSSKIRAQILKLVKSHQALGGRGGGGKHFKDVWISHPMLIR